MTDNDEPRAGPDRHINFDAPAVLRKWPSLNNQQRTEATGPYLLHDGTLDECLREFMSGKEPVSIPMPFLAEENRGGGPVRLTVNGRQLVWRTRFRSMPGAEEAFLRIKPSLINWLPIYSPLFTGIATMFQKGTRGQILLDVNELVRETLTMIDLDLRTNGISVKTDLRDGVLQLSGDRGQLQQVFLNLISNAIEAMNSVTDRARNLQVRTNFVQESSDVVVTVEDSGTGLGGEDKDRIFEPFFTTKSAGTGVGLTICRVIIESRGGSLVALANKPYGTIFEVTLPSGPSETS